MVPNVLPGAIFIEYTSRKCTICKVKDLFMLCVRHADSWSAVNGLCRITYMLVWFSRMTVPFLLIPCSMLSQALEALKRF